MKRFLSRERNIQELNDKGYLEADYRAYLKVSRNTPN
jgi:hypothetical protein